MKTTINDGTLKRIIALCDIERKKEFMTYLIGHVEEGNFLINDLFIPKQEGTTGGVEDDDGELLKFLSMPGSMKEGERLIGWLHTHPNMTAFLSGTDYKQIEEYLSHSPRDGLISIVLTPDKKPVVNNRMIGGDDKTSILNIEARAWISHKWHDKSYHDEIKIYVNGNVRGIDDIETTIINQMKKELKEKHSDRKFVVPVQVGVQVGNYSADLTTEQKMKRSGFTQPSQLISEYEMVCERLLRVYGLMELKHFLTKKITDICKNAPTYDGATIEEILDYSYTDVWTSLYTATDINYYIFPMGDVQDLLNSFITEEPIVTTAMSKIWRSTTHVL